MSIQRILPGAIPLPRYLEDLVDKRGETSGCSAYLRRLSLLPEQPLPNLQLPPSEESTAIRDILHRFIASELKQNSHPKNLLCLGYRTLSSFSRVNSSMRHHPNIECQHVNTLHDFFINPHWQEIADVYGETLVRHILARPCFLFNPETRNHIQICGPPIHLLQPHQSSPKTLPRNRMLYRSPSRFRVGLPRTHILHRADPLALYQSIFQNILAEIPSDMAISLQHLCQGIQVGYLHSSSLIEAMSAFTLPLCSPTAGIRDQRLRKRRRRGSRGGRRRKCFRRSAKSRREGSYSQRLHKGSPDDPQRRGLNLAKAILAANPRFHSQNSEAGSILGGDFDENRASSKRVRVTAEAQFTESKAKKRRLNEELQSNIHSKVDLTALSSPIQRVSHFLKSICRRVFSKVNIWKSRHNLNIFMKTVETYVHLNKGASLSLNECRLGMKISQMDWLRSFEPKSLQTKILDALVFWIFADFINPLLRNSFYITEVEGKFNQIHYYRKTAWDTIYKQGMYQLQSQFHAVNPTQNNNQGYDPFHCWLFLHIV